MNINEANIREEIKEINKYCVYCCIKKEKVDIIHCPLCNCCVENFLKHDLFLNICIGTKNYFIIIIYKVIFLIYLLFFAMISLFIIVVDINENEEITIHFINLSFFPNKNIIKTCSIVSSFILIIILFFKIHDFYILSSLNIDK